MIKTRVILLLLHIVVLSLLNHQLIVTLFIKCTFCNSILLTSKFFIASFNSNSTFNWMVKWIIQTLGYWWQAALATLTLILIWVFSKISILSVDLVLILFYLVLGPRLLISIIFPHKPIVIVYLALLLVLWVILISWNFTGVLRISLNFSVLWLVISIWISVWF